MQERSVPVEVYVDFCCPFCLIGLQHLSDAVSELKGSVRVDTTFRPFELDPNAPEEGVDIPMMLMKKHGVSPEQVWPPIEAKAKASGIPLDLRKQPFAYPTLSAHTLVRHAESKGTALAFATALSRAYFLDAKSIVDRSVLAEIASAHGFTHDEVFGVLDDKRELSRTREMARDAVRRGVRSVPTLIINQNQTLSASQPVATLKQAFEQAT